MFGNINSPSRSALLPAQALRLFDFYMQGTRTIDDDKNIVMELCLDADSVLSRIQKSSRKSLASSVSSASNESITLRQGIAIAYHELARLFEQLGHSDVAQSHGKKAEKWGYIQGSSNNKSSRSNNNRPNRVAAAVPTQTIVTISKDIFNHNEPPAVTRHSLPDVGTHLDDIHQLVYCLSLPPTASIPTNNLTDSEREWCQAISADEDEHERLCKLASDVIEMFISDETKTNATVAEVVALAPVLSQTQFRMLLMNMINGISQNIILETQLLEGLAQLIQRAPLGYLDSDDLVTILNALNSRLQGTHRQSRDHLYRLSATVSYVLDAMVNSQVKGLKREQLHEPLAAYLKGLKESSDPHLVYQAAYASQALLYIPDDESPMQGMLRRTSAVLQGVFGVVSAVKNLDLNAFMDEISNIQKELPSVTDIMDKSLQVYKETTSLYESGVIFRERMEEGLSFSRKSGWYPALRVADELLQTGELVKFKTLVCEVSCRNEAAFQWGLCQMLGQIAADTKWRMDTRQDAITFLGEIYKNDQEWGNHVHIKQWIVNILKQLSSSPLDGPQAANTLLKGLKTHGETKKHELYMKYLQEPLIRFSSVATLSPPTSSNLLDRAQKTPGVEDSLRQLKRQRMEIDNGQGFYIQQYAKASPQASDDKLFLLMDKVKEFLDSDQKVLLVQGDSGAGKSTFNRALERTLWDTYQKRHGRIPLFISLPAIDKPEKDLVAKQLRDYDFTDSEIKELKMNRSFILICDGYDESMQTNNLYVANQLNQPGKWRAQMVISCRSEYLGLDYRDRFQPMSRNYQADAELFGEAVIVPFSEAQVDEFIDHYVPAMDPMWEVEDYKRALKMVPSLQELVKNPFMLSMSLEVLPRMVDPDQAISSTKIKRVTLYDQFVEQWLERGKKRLGETLRPEDRRMFRILTDEGFAQHGLKYLKELAIAIYKHQDGNPVVDYSPFKDKGVWKEIYFSRANRRSLLREASPLTRTGNQYRFIHRSILEYSLVRAIFDPHPVMSASANDEEAKATKSPSRRQSISSVFSFEGMNIKEEEQEVDSVENDEASPLVWRSFVDEPSILQFLEDRVSLEPMFKQQLYTYVELSKSDSKWRIAAANAMTILVRSGEPFIRADLRGIQIPGADLNHGIFEYAQLQGADLRKVSLRKCWLREANLSGAKMAGVQFGEWPFLEASGEVSDGTYSPDGKTLAAVINESTIIVYDTSTWEKIFVLENNKIGNSLIYSPDSRHVVSWGCVPFTILIWDTRSGALVHRLVGHVNAIRWVEYSPSGSDLASASVDNSVRVWDAQTGIVKYILEGHTDALWSVTFSPDEKQIATGGDDKVLRLWDATSGQQMKMLVDHEARIEQIVYSPDGQEIIARCNNGYLRVRDARSGQKKHDLVHVRTVLGLQYSPNGKFVASHTRNKIWLWDMQTGKAIHTFEGQSYIILGIKFSPNGEEIVISDWDHTIRLWSTRSGQLINTLYGHSEEITSVAYSPNNPQVASFSRDGTIRLWDIRPQQSGHDLHNHPKRITDVKSSPDGQQIASCGGEAVRMWDMRTGQLIHVLKSLDRYADIKYSSDGQLLASRHDSPRVYLWNARTGQVIHTLEQQGEQDDRVLTMDFSPIDQQIVCGHKYGNVAIWDTQTGGLIRTLRSHNAPVKCVTFSPDGYQIASYNDSGKIRVWRAQSGNLQYEVEDEVSRGSNIIYTPDSRKIVFNRGYEHRSFQVRSAETGKLCYETQLDTYPESITFSPCSQQMALRYTEQFFSVVDLKSGKILHTCFEHTAYINDIAYSPDGRYIASCSQDMKVRVWNPETGQCLLKIPFKGGYIDMLVWNVFEGGHFLVTASQYASIQMWQIAQEGDQYQYYLTWSTKQTVLVASNTCIQDVTELSGVNRRLLVQHGAASEQASPLAAGEALNEIVAPSIDSKSKTASSQAHRHQGKPVEKALGTESLRRGEPLIRSIDTGQSIRDYRFKYSVCSECSFAHVISCKPRE